MAIKKVTFSLEEGLWEDFRYFCRLHDIKMSVVLDEIINDYLFRMNDQLAQTQLEISTKRIRTNEKH